MSESLCQPELATGQAAVVVRAGGSTPAATAAAVSALVMAEQYGDSSLGAAQVDLLDTAYRGDLSELLLASLGWIASRQCSDGGWGSGESDKSDLLTSLLVHSAFRLTCVPAADAECEPRLEDYIRRTGGPWALRKVGVDNVSQIGVLANCAAAGVVEWKHVPLVRIERAAAPDWMRNALAAPQFDQEDPVLLSAGIARLHRAKSRNPLLCWARHSSVDQCLTRIASRQSSNGAFDDSTQATSYVIASLASAGKASHPVVRKAVEYLLSAVDSDASWPANPTP